MTSKMTEREKQLKQKLIFKIGPYLYYKLLESLQTTYKFGNSEANLVNEINFRINSGVC